MHFGRLTVALAAALALGGCSSGGDEAPPTTGTASASATTTTTTSTTSTSAPSSTTTTPSTAAPVELYTGQGEIPGLKQEANGKYACAEGHVPVSLMLNGTMTYNGKPLTTDLDAAYLTIIHSGINPAEAMILNDGVGVLVPSEAHPYIQSGTTEYRMRIKLSNVEGGTIGKVVMCARS